MTGDRLRALAERVDAATPPGRDRAVDGLRAVAILGVISGHWLVTALVVRDGGLRAASPLATMPAFAPVSWILQTLAIFFFVGGYSGAKGYRGRYPAWLRARLGRLFRPAAVLLAAWAALTVALVCAGVPGSTLRTLLTLTVSPLWFLSVYAALTASIPVLLRCQARFGAATAVVPAAVVLLVDLARFRFGGPAWLGWVNLPAGWLVPFLLGVAWAGGALVSRRPAVLLLGGGAAATAALVLYAGYPASMVGVPGAAVSNLNPPSLAAVTFGIAQVGAALLVRDGLARRLRHPPAWAAVVVANLSAMTLFLWHQTALMLVTLAGRPLGVLAGLHTVPAGAFWALERLAWFPVFAAALAALCLTFHRFERT
ncbi:acyltransferase family protein [Actinomadura scrupuli]|uniref:acyltransferase family protein n=1 Tax=Actinomadura scrupuli TaxID=559629 RepID=UPI003D9703AA